MIEGFFDRRRELVALGVLLVDARLGPTDLDRAMREWLDEKGIPFVVAASKMDKIGGDGRLGLAGVLEDWLHAAGACRGFVLTSAKTGLGIRETWRHLDGALADRRSGVKGEGWISVS